MGFIGRTLFSLLGFLVLIASSDAFAAYKTVVVISVDGLGAQLLSRSHAPVIKSLGEQAARAETVIPTKTLPAHTSMMTGVTPERHGILANDRDAGVPKVAVPTIFDLVRAAGLRSVAVLGKEKIKYIFDDGSIDEFWLSEWPLVGDYPSRTESYIYSATERALRADVKPNLLFIHFALVDSMGHTFGWESFLQRTSVTKVDRALGRILKSLDKHLPAGSYAVILTADHGGHGMSHGQMSSEGVLENRESDLPIPWIVRGAKIKSDAGTIRVYDTAPTAAALLGLSVPTEWKWEGRNVVDVP